MPVGAYDKIRWSKKVDSAHVRRRARAGRSKNENSTGYYSIRRKILRRKQSAIGDVYVLRSRFICGEPHLRGNGKKETLAAFRIFLTIDIPADQRVFFLLCTKTFLLVF